jgi:Domain of unknown function (DUF4440)
MQRALLLLAVGFAVATSSASCAARSGEPGTPASTDAEVEATVLRLSQELLDAVTHGRADVWRRILDPRALVTDEDGKVYTAGEIIAEIRPLPAGYEGELRIENARFSTAGDLALLTYDIREKLSLYGQTLHTHFRSTDVYRRAGGTWKLFTKQSLVIPSELAPVAVDASRYADYVGSYALGPDAVLTVTREGDRLYCQRGERPVEEMFPVGSERFVRKGHPRGERFFRRDAQGAVVALVDRRDNIDLVWKRTGAP